ncbi:hypothetical protein [Wolbachia endosymbiont (group A) of Pogonocherus hispidulus]|uniref:hypothetical protein n=1 Tax=Wolbachia endosymbiont (group A) of Pogonocherus hispidulus TaxID=3066136 RepID=UPI00397B4267
MSNKIIVPFNDKEGGTYELNIDLDRLSKGEMLNAIRGIGRTVEKNQRSNFTNETGNKNDLSRLPEIFDVIKDMDRTSKKNWRPIFASKTGNKKTQTMPSPQINCGEGHNLYNTKSLRRARGSNPFVPPLNEIEPNAIESRVLESVIRAVAKAGSVSKLIEVKDVALRAGIRTNAYHDGQRSFADAVMLKMLSIQCTKDEQKEIIRELIREGAMFSYDLLQDKRINEVHNELYQEVQPQIEKRLEELREVGKNAVRGGSVEDVGIDNKTFYMKFSKGSTVEPAKVLEGTRNLGLNKGWVELGGHIMKIGDNEVEVKIEKGGERNYTGLSDGGNLTMTLHSDHGEVKIRLCHDTENYDRVQVIVEDKETWEKLQKEGRAIRENCLLGGKTIEEAIKEGGFKRSGMWSKERVTEEIKEASKNNSSETLSSWADRTRRGSEAISRK